MTADIEDVGIQEAPAYQLHRTNRLLLTHLGRFLGDHDNRLTPESYFVIMKLRESGPLSQGKLVDVVLDDGPNVSRLVDRLVKNGIVERREDPNDRRARMLDLTPDGRSLAARVADDLPGIRTAILAGITKDELAAFESVLQRLCENAQQQLASGVNA